MNYINETYGHIATPDTYKRERVVPPSLLLKDEETEEFKRTFGFHEIMNPRAEFARPEALSLTSVLGNVDIIIDNETRTLSFLQIATYFHVFEEDDVDIQE